MRPRSRGVAFDAWGRSYALRSTTPICCLVERGPGAGSLDRALLEQALSLGVEVRFGSRKRTLEGRGIFASGPRAADTIAVSYHFDTCLADGFRGILDDRLAPGGNAYLLSLAGFGMRHAMLSGVLAARSLMDGTDYDASWRREMKRPMETTRAIYGGLGNHGYRWLLRAQAWTADSRAFLGWLYRSARLSRLLLPWAQRRFA